MAFYSSAPTQWEGTAVEPQCDFLQPLVDPTVLRRLRAELDPDEDYCRIFVRNYMEQLPSRISRLRWALRSGDLEAAMDAVLSLKTSSQMVGACCLGGIADELESALKKFPDSANPASTTLSRLGSTFLRRIDQCSGGTVTCLTAANAA
ncbi:Hpt domain-containing protein [Pseudarthrobacter sp. N5]|uniref:Hpt domain-containing protein n=1 Tax=Pseudarthrobacter sp. N5 TaxID=3418416 RepID=UPI003CF1B79C